ncbi:hypothetical protein [Polycladidibacter hongkongensis]|uniref:hypothetical protein n=1 Tax=Polycladidibacter hongkongensis TaxID=1647556 RepID=UPI00083308A9|nr:hypothetical protein [Pseudovibrio hongkongensis]
MNQKRAALLIALLIGSTGFGEAKVPAQGELQFSLSNTLGITNDGRPIPSLTSACEEAGAHFLFQTVAVQYRIGNNSPSSATMHLAGEKVALRPLKLAGTHTFIATGLPKAFVRQNVKVLFFSISGALNHPSVGLHLQYTANERCYLGSTPLGISH